MYYTVTVPLKNVVNLKLGFWLLKEEVKEWLSFQYGNAAKKKFIVQSWKVTGPTTVSITFENEEDATLFKLRWS